MSKRSRQSFPAVCRDALLDQVPSIMETLRQDVLWRDGLPSGPCQWLQAIYPLAYLYRTDFPGNVYRGDPAVLEMVEQTGDYLSACLRPRKGQDFSHSAISLGATLDWAVLFWLDAYGLIGDKLGPTRRRRWEAALGGELKDYARRLGRFMDQGRFNSCSFGTSPNHVISYAADLLTGGLVMKNRAWVKLAEDFAERFVESQTPAGYWAEGHGPVGGYQSVSLAGVARLHALRPRPIYRQAMERALDYHETISYPDHSFVAVIDKRQRYHAAPSITGVHGFTFCPRGRALAKAVMTASPARGPRAGGSHWARLLENFVYFQGGAIPAHRPWRGRRWLENHTCLVREHGWQYNLSVNPVVVNPASQFRLECGSLYSIWHESVGLIVSGSQDKNRPWHDTFYSAGERALGVLHGGRIADLCEPKYLEALYASGLTGRIEVSQPRPNSLSLAVSLRGRRAGGRFFFNMPFRVGAGETIRVAGRSVTLSRRKLAMGVPAEAEMELFDGKVRLRCSAPGRLHFPCQPYNSYGPSRRSKLPAAFGRFEIPIKPANPPVRIRIRV